MAQDPVLQREMFNTRGRSAKGSGITSMVDDGSSGMTREERLQMAKDMLAEAQMKQNPEYYFNTLAQGDRPAMTRPVASSAPPPAMQPMPAAQQMAQMQAAGVRPVGMADGGIVRRGFAEAGLVKKDDPYGLEALKSDPAWSNLTFDQRNQLAVEQYNKIAAQRPEAQSRPSIDLLTPEYLGSEDAEKFKDRLTDQSNLSFEERNAKEARAKDKYYDDKAEQILNEQAGLELKPLEGESTTAFSRSTLDPLKEGGEGRKEALKDRIKKSLMLQDANAGSDSVSNAFNLFTEESSLDRSLRQANEERMRSNIEKYGTIDRSLTTTPEKDALDKRDYAQEREGIASLARETEDAAARERAMPDKRDYAQEREGIASLARINADQVLRDQAMPDKRDYDQERLARREAVRIPEDPTLQGKSAPPVKIVSGVPGAAVAQDQASAAKDQAGAAGGSNEPARYSATTTLESIKSERAKEREDNFNMALIQAGLAMMGGKSSNALANIGEGGMQGIKQFAEQERESSRGYREDVKGVRDEERFGRTYDQNERMQAASLAAQADLARATREATAAENAAERRSREGMFSRTEARMVLADERAFAQSSAGQDLARQKLKLDELVAKNQMSRADADAAMKDAQFNSAQAWDKEKTQIVTSAPSETIKLYTLLGDGDPKAGYSKIAAAAERKDALVAAKEIVRDMTGSVTEQEKEEAVKEIMQILRAGSPNDVAPSYTEGMTATNVDGKKIIFRGGNWVAQ